MERQLKILGIVGSPSAGGKTEAAVRHVLDAARAAGDVEASVLLLSEDLDTPDGRRAEERTGVTREMLDAVEAADMVVFGTPTHRATFSVAVKQCLDLVPRGTYDGDTAPLRAKPVAVVATGALPHHFLAPDALVGILVGFFAAWVVPPAIYASGGDFDDAGELVSPSVLEAAATAGTALVALARAADRDPALAAPNPQL
jgi:FMN reductase